MKLNLKHLLKGEMIMIKMIEGIKNQKIKDIKIEEEKDIGVKVKLELWTKEVDIGDILIGYEKGKEIMGKENQEIKDKVEGNMNKKIREEIIETKQDKIKEIIMQNKKI